MGLKTLFEKFGGVDEMSDPFDFQKSPEEAVLVISTAAPAAEMPKQVATHDAGGKTLTLPTIANTKTVEVMPEQETFKGELPHLTPDEHQMVVDWFDKASTDTATPLEVRAFLTEIAMKLKLDAKKRVANGEKKSSE